MKTATEYPLLEHLSASGRHAPEALEQAERAFAEFADDPVKLADRLHALGLVTKYQQRKIQIGRTSELLFGQYLILDRIGEGGMGKVYRAVESRLGRDVALKTIRPNLMMNKTVVQRYKREARATAALKHPNVVELYEADEIQGRYYLCMEFVDGSDLARLNKELQKEQRTMPPGEAAEYMRQAALGLQAAHDMNLVHRDIKPSNLLVSGERAIPGTDGKAVVKLLDLGLVRSLTEEDATSTDLTRDGTVVGTPDYMSPEQAKNSSTVDHRADIYSLGCTFFYLLKGSAPYPDGTAIDKLIRHQLDPIPDIRQFRPDVPPGLAGVIKKMMAKKPEARYQTGAEVAKELALWTLDAATFDFGTPAPAFQAVDFAPTTKSPKPTNTTPTREMVPPAMASAMATLPPGMTAPMTGETPKTTPTRKVLKAKPILKPVSDGTPSGDLAKPPVVQPKKKEVSPESPTPTRSRRPGSRRTPPKKPKGIPILLVAVAGAVGVGLIVALALILSANGTPSTVPTTAPPTLAQAPPLAKSPLRPIADLLPDKTAAVAILHPQAYWYRLQSEVETNSSVKKNAEFLSKFYRFDAGKYDRMVIAFHANSNKCVAAGEGETISKSDSFRKELDGLVRFQSETDKSGAVLLKRKLPNPNPFNSEKKVRAVYLPAPHAYLIGSDAAELGELHSNPATRKGPEGVDPKLLESLDAATAATDRPFAFFAAAGDWLLPAKPKGTPETLKKRGIDRAEVEIRLGDDFEFRIDLFGADSKKLSQFLEQDLPLVIEAWADGPNGRLLADTIRDASAGLETTDAGGLKRVRLKFRCSFAVFQAVLDKIVPMPGLPDR